MKLKLLSYSLLFMCISLSVKAYEVSTSIQKKNILLEEFTGIHCGFCPQGHAIAKILYNSHPENVYLIAVHAGNFANPGKDEPDFRTEAGILINEEFQIEQYGYPSGTINRHAFSSPSIITGRASWIKDAKEIHTEDAPVNLWMKSEFDGDNRKIQIRVEGYYTQEFTASSHRLNIAVTESNIKGPQSGGGVGNEYIHNHMLRDFVTPLWGDLIQDIIEDKYFVFEYSYSLPEEINGIEIYPEEIELIAFVTCDKTEVLNVTGEKPTFKNYDKPLNASIYEHFRPVSSRYGYHYFEVMLKNGSDKKITDAEFLISINEKETEIAWQGNIPAFHTLPIKIETEVYELTEQNEYKISLIGLNGEKIIESTIQGKFSAPLNTSSKITVEIQTDLYADENTFFIKDKKGITIKELGPYPSGIKEVYKEEIELDKNEIYCFEVIDLWGDGIQQPKGYYKLYDENNTMFAQQYDIKEYGDRVFFQTTGVTSIINEENNGSKLKAQFYKQDGNLYLIFPDSLTEKKVVRIYDITGKQILEKTIYSHPYVSTYIDNITNWNKGAYILTLLQNGKTETLKLTIH